MKTFYTRAITALIFGFVVIGALLYHSYSFAILMMVILVGCILEFYEIASPLLKRDGNNFNFYRNMMLITSLYGFVLFYGVATSKVDSSALYTLPLLCSIFFLIELFLTSKRPFRSIGINLVVMYYVALPLSWILILGHLGGQFTGCIVLGIFLIIWANDTGAYIIGSLIGKHKLIPHVSPNKSIEGFLGGAVFCFLFAYLNINFISKLPMMSHLTLIRPYVWYAIATTTFIFATTGDLVESLLKRQIGIKDSGRILPGHGGFLDRFDAFLFVVPFIVALVKILN